MTRAIHARRQGDGAAACRGAGRRRPRRCCRTAGRRRRLLSATRDETAVASYQLERLVAGRLRRRHPEGARRRRRRPRRQPCARWRCRQSVPLPAALVSEVDAARRRAAEFAHGRATPGRASSPAMPRASRRWPARWRPTSAAWRRARPLSAGRQLCGRRGDRHDHGGAGRGRHHADRRHGLLARRDAAREGRRQHWSRSSTASAACRGRCAAR